ncbi:MAG TPA: LapA family protein [Candidatus Methylomirabilis sp.]|nr:LapA family protein [Candidatus Methylomirabilis sp.]
MRPAYFIAGLLLGVAVAIFALQNTGTVEVRFLLWQAQGSLALVVLSALGAGLLVALLFGIPEALLARWRIRSLERRLQERPHETPGEPRLRDAA